MQKKKIVIGFFGITRSLKWTASSIKKNIITVLQSLGDVKIYGHFYELKFIKNERTGENQTIDLNDHKNLKFDKLVIEKPMHVLKNINYKKILSYGDAWEDKGRSLSNLIHQLSSLKKLAKMIKKEKPDVVVLVRPDLLYHDSFKEVVKLHLKLPSYYASIPHWQWFGGLNDRFAVLGYEAFLIFANRLDSIHDYLKKTKKPLHSETFLWDVLTQNKIIILPMNIKAHRVRANGTMAQEGFEELFLRRKIRYQLMNLKNKLKRFIT